MRIRASGDALGWCTKLQSDSSTLTAEPKVSNYEWSFPFFPFLLWRNLSVFIMELGLSGIQSISSELMMRTVEGGKEAKEWIKWGLDWMQRVWFRRQLVCDSGGQDKGRSTSSGSQRDAGAPDHHKSSFKVQTSDQRKRTPGRIFFFFLKPTADTPEAGGLLCHHRSGSKVPICRIKVSAINISSQDKLVACHHSRFFSDLLVG